MGKAESSIIAAMRNEAKKSHLDIVRAFANMASAGKAYTDNPSDETRRIYEIAALQYGKAVLQKYAYDVALE